MAHPTGESESNAPRLNFDRRLKLEFHGSNVTSDAGLLAYRELDNALGLMEIAGQHLADTRTGKNGRHVLIGMLRQSVFGRLAGYEDVNDADRLGHDPAMRWIVGGRAATKQAASASQMGRFETERLANDENFAALADLSGHWIDRVHSRRPPNGIVLDMDSSVSPTYGDQEGTAYNGHFACTCYHPLFVFNQFGDLERSTLRPGNVHSADGWKEVLEPVMARYRGKLKRRYFRADAAFANPAVYEFLEAEGFTYAIRLPAQSDTSTEDRLLAQAPCWASSERGPTVLRQLQLSGAKLEGGAPRGGEGRVAPRRALSARRLHRYQPDETGGTGCCLLQQARHGGTVDQGRQERHQVDAAVMLLVCRQRSAASASHACLQSRQLHADAGSAGGSQAVVADEPEGEARQDRGQDRHACPVCHLPDGRGRGAKGIVPGNLAADRRAATKTGPKVGLARSDASSRREECV